MMGGLGLLAKGKLPRGLRVSFFATFAEITRALALITVGDFPVCF
jgi:hypothetical protein